MVEVLTKLSEITNYVILLQIAVQDETRIFRRAIGLLC